MAAETFTVELTVAVEDPEAFRAAAADLVRGHGDGPTPSSAVAEDTQAAVAAWFTAYPAPFPGGQVVGSSVRRTEL